MAQQCGLLTFLPSSRFGANSFSILLDQSLAFSLGGQEFRFVSLGHRTTLLPLQCTVLPCTCPRWMRRINAGLHQNEHIVHQRGEGGVGRGRRECFFKKNIINKNKYVLCSIGRTSFLLWSASPDSGHEATPWHCRHPTTADRRDGGSAPCHCSSTPSRHSTRKDRLDQSSNTLINQVRFVGGESSTTQEKLANKRGGARCKKTQQVGRRTSMKADKVAPWP